MMMTEEGRYTGFSGDLLSWYDREARVLPWRSDPVPYKVWVSEMMLQQTRVDTVIPYFLRFIEELPGVPELAAVPEDRLLKLWQGLGYYNRARNLKKAAEMMMEEYQGRLPDTPEMLEKLPGIGTYSAGAIASIAFSKPVPAVDGNVLRILLRLEGSREDIGSSATKKWAAGLIREWIPEDRPGDFNQALMDLGATICLPNGEPLCGNCPVSPYCRARDLNLIREIPVKAEKKKRLQEKKTVLILQHGNDVAIRKRQEAGLLSGLWEFPNLEGHQTEEEIRRQLVEWDITVLEMEALASSRHIFSHREWAMTAWRIRTENKAGLEDWVWVSREELEMEYSVPTAFRVYRDMELNKV